ncbi:hypothetical protein PGT21_017659 [Puccinia graminis f. sp. tritici]|uniref:Uncharacterized protein n=1 Tax=Puccinia graminis f. sp. tritici TaxID=56615 RepID=A0A5B0QWL1_PUCGR|nr:hypothetical protein PGT21_017659 [Puccinia graminis f. sp. tritici]
MPLVAAELNPVPFFCAVLQPLAVFNALANLLSNFLTVFRRYLHSDRPRFYTGQQLILRYCLFLASTMWFSFNGLQTSLHSSPSQQQLPYFNWQQTVINGFDINSLDAVPSLANINSLDAKIPFLLCLSDKLSNTVPPFQVDPPTLVDMEYKSSVL